MGSASMHAAAEMLHNASDDHSVNMSGSIQDAVRHESVVTVVSLAVSRHHNSEHQRRRE